MKNTDLIELSLFLRLLSLFVESGLDFTTSLKCLTLSDSDSSVHTHFRKLLADITIGQDKEAALTSLRHSCPHSAIENVSLSLQSAWNYGSPLSPLLKEQAQQIQDDCMFQMERNIQKRQLMLLLPLFLLVLPATLIVLVIPLLIQLFHTQ